MAKLSNLAEWVGKWIVRINHLDFARLEETRKEKEKPDLIGSCPTTSLCMDRVKKRRMGSGIITNSVNYTYFRTLREPQLAEIITL